jgi:hypothetical protein
MNANTNADTTEETSDVNTERHEGDEKVEGTVEDMLGNLDTDVDTRTTKQREKDRRARKRRERENKDDTVETMSGEDALAQADALADALTEDD